MIRSFLAAAAVLTITLPSAADPGSHCDGAYAEAATLVDAALSGYGTLYSGGNHWHRVDDVGATLDLYRFWRGLPDIGLRRFETPYPSSADDAFRSGWNWDLAVEDVWARARWALSPDAPADAATDAIVWAGFGFDILTSRGPAPDWWHRPEAFEQLTDWQRWLAAASTSEPALDWLQTVLSASNAPWANHWHLAVGADAAVIDAHQRLAAAAFARFEAGDGIEWLAAAAINSADPTRPWTRSLHRTLSGIATEISRCEASPQAYAAYAIGQTVRDRRSIGARSPGASFHEHLPQTVRRTMAVNRLYSFAIQNRDAPFEEVATAIAGFRAFAPDDPEWQQMVDLAQLYAAEAIEHVPVSDHAYARRAYNLLSANDIAALAQREDLDPALARAAFARHVALENWDSAEALLPILRAATPERADDIDRIWALDHPTPVRLALIVLDTPNLSTVITGGDRWGDVAMYHHQHYVDGVRNLPRNYAGGGVLQRDFEAWLRLPQRWDAFRGRWGFTIDWIDRAYDRLPRHAVAHLPAPSLIPDRASGRGANFESLIAWGEIGHLATDARLMHTVARVILAWTDQRTDSLRERLFGDHGTEAEALAALVYLCRFNSCGAVEGVPAQRRAFQLLHFRLPNAPAARETRYWWESPAG